MKLSYQASRLGYTECKALNAPEKHKKKSLVKQYVLLFPALKIPSAPFQYLEKCLYVCHRQELRFDKKNGDELSLNMRFMIHFEHIPITWIDSGFIHTCFTK